MVKPDAVRQSAENVLSSARQSRRAFDKTWAVAARAPVFCKITKKQGRDGKNKKFFRTTRLISGHAYNIAASGAALRAARILSNDCDVMRIEHNGESARAPWLPMVSKGAKLLLEQFLAALAQEAAYKSHAAREGAGNSQRLNRSHAVIGWNHVVSSVFGSSALVPSRMLVLPLPPKGPKKAKSEKAPRKPRSKKATAAVEEAEEFAEPVEGTAADLDPED